MWPPISARPARNSSCAIIPKNSGIIAQPPQADMTTIFRIYLALCIQQLANAWQIYTRSQSALGFTGLWAYGASAAYGILRFHNGFQKNTRNIFPRFIRW